MLKSCARVALVAGALLPASAVLSQVSATLVAINGGTLPGSGASTVSSVNTPFTTANGKVGFAGVLSPTDGFIYYDGAIIWKNSDAAPGATLTGVEGTMGIGDAGQFLYSPTVSPSLDSAWNQSGAVAVEGQTCPDGSGLFWTFASRPMMLPDGTMHFMGGTSATSGAATSNRGMWRFSPDGATCTRILGGGDVIGGFTLSTAATNFAYWVSDNAAHHVHLLTSTDPTASNVFVYVDGQMRHRKSTATGSPLADNWENHTGVAINNSGDYVFYGDTSAATTVDAFIAWNGRIKVREGDAPGGFLFASGSGGRAISINNRGQVGAVWGVTALEAVIFGYGPVLKTNCVTLLKTGDTIDTNGDTVADYTVTDFNAAATVAPGLDLATNHKVYVEVGLTPIGGGTELDAIVGVDVPAGYRCPADWDHSGALEPADIAVFVTQWAADLSNNTLFSDYDGNDAVTPADVAAIVTAWSSALTNGC